MRKNHFTKNLKKGKKGEEKNEENKILLDQRIEKQSLKYYPIHIHDKCSRNSLYMNSKYKGIRH